MSKILIVDDDQAIRTVAGVVLKGAGNEVVAAGRCDDGLALARSSRPDLIILDVNLPDGSGLDLCRDIRKDLPDVPVVFLTVHGCLESRLKGFQAGANDYLPKPFSVEELKARVAAHLDAHEKSAAWERRTRELELRERLRQDLNDMIVHDLKSPLTSIQATLSVLRESGLVSGEDYGRLLESSERAAGRLLVMINDLLDVSRAEAEGLKLEPKETDLARLLDGVVELLKPAASRQGVEVSFSAPPGAGKVVTDPALLYRIMVNLASNAIRHSPAPGEVRVEWRLDGGRLRLAVLDRGPGVPDAFKEKIFEKFVQLGDPAQAARFGTGVGLTFCKLAAGALGGRVWVEDREGGGSRFVVELPLAGPPECRPRVAEAPK